MEYKDGANQFKLRYLEILLIHEHTLRKPLEIGVAELRENGVVIGWVAAHHLPSSTYVNGIPTGKVLVGEGRTLKEAGNKLCEIIAELWDGLKIFPEEELVDPDSRLQQQYLRTLFLE